jgi:hypothetical protein
MRTPAYTAAEHDTRRHARRGLAIYFAVLVPFSAVFETLMIVGGGSSWVWALMWTPGAASIVARLILREGFADVSFRLGGRRGARAIVIAVLFPIVIGLISYGIAWTLGLAHFRPQPDALAARFVGDSTPPIVVFVINLALAATIVAVVSARVAAETIGGGPAKYTPPRIRGTCHRPQITPLTRTGLGTPATALTWRRWSSGTSFRSPTLCSDRSGIRGAGFNQNDLPPTF